MNPEALIRDRPDAHWILIENNGEIRGRCSLWWQRTPSLPGHAVGTIGHYFVSDSAAARELLSHACSELRLRGCALAVGPMDGNTWRRYRMITERGKEPVFFLEPDNPDDWPDHFISLGFKPLAHYTSAINTDLTRKDPRIPEVARRLETQGICIRPLDVRRLDDDIRSIYRVSIVSFRNNFLYADLSERDFIDQYRALIPFLQPDLVLLAEQRERTVGFIFALPDVLQARRGEEINTVILKTVAVLPERAHAGLGGLLIARCHETAGDLGYRRAIHALMHEANGSRNISRHYAQIMRRYTLFARSLD